MATPKEPPTMPPTERAPILKEIDLMVAARSKKGDIREYVDASSLTDQEHASIIEEIKSGRLPKREKGESREQFLKRDAEYRAWIREAWERLGHPKRFSKTRKRVAILMVERKMAISVAAAEAMIRAGLIQGHSGRRITDTKARCPENAQIKLQSDQLINPPAVFARRDRKPAISSTTHSRVLDPDDGDDCEPLPSVISSPISALVIRQQEMERWLLRWNHFREMDDWMVSALRLGARVERGVHTAELLPMHDEDGRTYLKVFVR